MTRNNAAPASTNSDLFQVHTSLVFDPQTKTFRKNITFTINPKDGLIKDIQSNPPSLPDKIAPPDIDLRSLTVLPGLVDAHTHIFLHPYKDTPPLNQMRDESFVERIVRATNHVREALMAGYTTYRDLGTEGLGDADVSFRDTINRGIIPGPRLFVATEILASSGGYEVRQENKMGGTIVPNISYPVDGPVAARAAVRRRIGAGCDIVKVYAGKLRLCCIQGSILK
jgi:imidazolonepropionase-like amidohydrolase